MTVTGCVVCCMKAVYHADFEKNIRGTIMTVTDDQEMKRAKEVANIISQAAYTRRHSNSENTDIEHRICKSVVYLYSSLVWRNVLMLMKFCCSVRCNEFTVASHSSE